MAWHIEHGPRDHVSLLQQPAPATDPGRQHSSPAPHLPLAQPHPDLPPASRLAVGLLLSCCLQSILHVAARGTLLQGESHRASGARCPTVAGHADKPQSS
ncbi:uncharacterized protein LOC119865650 isoform X1 [Canis lupus familiaris]|uniref:uncharacterized protein LOC119865650 isoform X1 n=1 Tax=Canis lupus familiaris TaxID=9615 RepID=UPI0018F40160|nr:uncharacterized protein LOC119865650 isoform X1 [Canis lupus familiaris]XP_038314064.1 uncharacterized protein LOC119865650 isoform X1 [Canis lupus familiaris]XP_038427898.1 uncharacterized protein LOC119865650 isoform X1 [Canis lupus familiaris]